MHTASAAGPTFNTGGKVKRLHSLIFDIVDDELAYVVTAKIFALSAYRLLQGRGCKSEGNCKRNYQPIFTKENISNIWIPLLGQETYQ